VTSMADPSSADGAARLDIDPALSALLDGMPEFTIDDGVEVVRERTRARKPPRAMLPDMRIEDRTVGYGELTDIPVRIYWPPIERQRDLPVVVFYHGGGWAVGDLDTNDHLARAHAVGAEAVVVAVDYRLAPENPFPAGVEDAWAALRWVAEHAEELGGDPARIAVAGDSAGGNLSAVMALRARDAGGPRLVFQLLWYPATVFDMTTASFAENANAPILTHDALAAFLAWYAPEADFTNPKSWPNDMAPANADSHVGLPPAYIGTAGHDPLRDDGARYAELLSAAGVPVELRNEPTLVHGYIGFAGVVPAATQATDRGLAALRAALYG
jgi:acetyl esterase